MKRGKLSLWSIVIPLICILIFFSCKKTEEVHSFEATPMPQILSLEFENAFSETKWEKVSYLDKMTPYVMTGYGSYERADKFKGGNIFAVQKLIDDVFFNENILINNLNITPENKNKIETIYYEYVSGYISEYLNSIFSEDRVRGLKVSVEPNNKEINVSVNIDGEWKLKLDKNGKYIILPNGTREREYIPVSPDNVREAEVFIKNIININQNANNTVTIRTIPVDRTALFAYEDAKYFKQQKYNKKDILFSLVGLIIVSLLCSIVIIKYKQKIIKEGIK